MTDRGSFGQALASANAMAPPRSASELPGLPPIPLVGGRLGPNLMRLFSDPLRVLRRLHREHGTIAAVTRGDPSLVCAFGPEHNQQLLPHAREFEHWADLPIRVREGSALARVQVNLTAMNGERHRTQRRLMMPAFSKAAVHEHGPDMLAIAERHLARWRPGAKIDVAQAMLELTLDVMMKCLFGLDVGDQAAELGGMGKAILEGLISPAVAMLPVDLPLTPYGRLMRLTERYHARLLEMVRERRGSSDPRRDVLSILIRAHDEDGARLSDDELIGHIGMLFLAGHETSAYALTWTLLLLAQHPRVCADLHDELAGKLRGEPPRVEQLAELPLLDAVVNESMRLLPPSYMMFMRRATDEFQLGPYSLPRGSTIVLSPLVTHHMPEVYADPDRFVPQRWLQSTKPLGPNGPTKPSLFEFMPFGAGPRMCIGAGFAEQEIRLVLALIVQRHRLRMLDGARVDLRARGITMGPKQAVPMVVEAPGAAASPAASVGGSIRELVHW